MTVEELRNLMEKHESEYCKFEHVEKRLHSRPDLHAFLMLDQLVPSTKDMIAGAEHDKIYLEVRPSELEESSITENQVIDLIRCGVFYDTEYDCFAMFARYSLQRLLMPTLRGWIRRHL